MTLLLSRDVFSASFCWFLLSRLLSATEGNSIFVGFLEGVLEALWLFLVVSFSPSFKAFYDLLAGVTSFFVVV
jgi:hypothetical protein